MGGRRIAVIALSGALVAGGTGAAIAAVTKDDRSKVEQAVLDDAAKRLNVTPEKLRDALSAAQDAQLDQAVKDGKLTQERADKIKAVRKQSGSVLGGPMIGRGLRGGRHELHLRGPGLAGAKGGMIGDLAGALGLSTEKLLQQLRAGKSITDVAKAQGKSLADVRSALKASLTKRLDKAVKDGDLTRKQADAMLEHIDDAIEHLGSKSMRLRRHHRFGPDEMPARPDLRPGAFEPGDHPPQPVPVPGVFL